jgi:hypothetical protein
MDPVVHFPRDSQQEAGSFTVAESASSACLLHLTVSAQGVAQVGFPASEDSGCVNLNTSRAAIARRTRKKRTFFQGFARFGVQQSDEQPQSADKEFSCFLPVDSLPGSSVWFIDILFVYIH